MQDTSLLYQSILTSNNYYVETSIVITDPSSGAGQSYIYGEDLLMSVKTTRRTFKSNVPEVGCCMSGEIYVEMLMPDIEIPKSSKIVLRVRLVSTADDRVSEWIQKGTFFIDSRTNTQNDDNLNILSIHGYDSMLKTDQIYPSTSIAFPSTDIIVVNDIASKIGVTVEPRTITLINRGYAVQLPVEYTMREVLGYIAGMYAGNWIINDLGQLQLIGIYDLPEETNLLLDENNFYIVFSDSELGNVRIVL